MPTAVVVLPETVQIDALEEEKLTVRPEEAVAVKDIVAPTGWAGMGAKVIVWVFRTVKL
jgi:hypothetical protein